MCIDWRTAERDAQCPRRITCPATSMTATRRARGTAVAHRPHLDWVAGARGRPAVERTRVQTRRSGRGARRRPPRRTSVPSVDSNGDGDGSHAWERPHAGGVVDAAAGGTTAPGMSASRYSRVSSDGVRPVRAQSGAAAHPRRPLPASASHGRSRACRRRSRAPSCASPPESTAAAGSRVAAAVPRRFARSGPGQADERAAPCRALTADSGATRHRVGRAQSPTGTMRRAPAGRLNRASTLARRCARGSLHREPPMSISHELRPRTE
jgi:hypothetical protein